MKTDKVIINMMVLIKSYNKKGILYFNIELICTILTKILHFSLKVGFLPLVPLRYVYRNATSMTFFEVPTFR